MGSYRSSIRLLLINSICFSLLTATQVVLNYTNQRTIITIIFLVLFLAYVVLTILISLDLIKKDINTMKVQVLHVNNEIIKVIKPNGKIRRIRILRSEIGKYDVGQELELSLTKRMRQIVNVEIAPAPPQTDILK
jgi:alpha-amylase/alpha-mannosidase (GH57 family)